MERSNETRLAVMETDIKYIKEGQDELKEMLKGHIAAQCTGSCETAKDVIALRTSTKTYKRITWGTLTIMLAAFVKSLIPG